MCGSNSQQTDVSDEENQFYKTLTDQYATVFPESQAIVGALTNEFTPILNAGPSQTGFSPSELTALNTQNTEGVATDYAQAQKATAQVLAARGGGNTLLPSSVDANILAQNANAAAQTRAQGANQITQQNYAQGYQNWQAAANVLGSTAGLINPTSYSGAATNAGTAAMTGATDIANAANSPWNAAFGALGAVGGGLATRPPATCWIAAEIFGGWREPRTVLVRNWLLTDFGKGWMGSKVLNLYRKYGKQTAAAIRRHPSLRLIFTPLFSLALNRAKRRQKWTMQPVY